MDFDKFTFRQIDADTRIKSFDCTINHTGALPYEISLELGKSGEDCEEQIALRCSGVEPCLTECL